MGFKGQHRPIAFDNLADLFHCRFLGILERFLVDRPIFSAYSISRSASVMVCLPAQTEKASQFSQSTRPVFSMAMEIPNPTEAPIR